MNGLLGSHHVHTGGVLSTVIILLGHTILFLFSAPSDTLSAGNVNVTVQSTPDKTTYLNVYSFPFVTPVTVTLLKLTYGLLNITSPVVKSVVTIHTQVSVQVSFIVQTHHPLIDVLPGFQKQIEMIIQEKET